MVFKGIYGVSGGDYGAGFSCGREKFFREKVWENCPGFFSLRKKIEPDSAEKISIKICYKQTRRQLRNRRGVF